MYDWNEFLKKYRHVVISFVVILAIGVSGGIFLLTTLNNESGNSDTMIESNTVQSKQIVVVDVKGSVMKPGVYELPLGSRVKDAINLAGGLSLNADQISINLSQLLSDEMVIIVLEKGDQRHETQSHKINLNRATLEQLTQLKGIGKAKAQAIIDYRNSGNLFKTIDDLKKIKGISERLINAIRNDVSVQ